PRALGGASRRRARAPAHRAELLRAEGRHRLPGLRPIAQPLQGSGAQDGRAPSAEGDFRRAVEARGRDPAWVEGAGGDAGVSVRRAKLADICIVVGGGTPARSIPEYYGGSIPWVTPKDMKTWEIHDAQVRITEAGLQNSATRLVPPNSILIVVRSGVLKHTVPVAINRVAVAINQDMKALLCAESANPDYVARFIKARQSVILQWVRATTADNFPVDKLKHLEIPRPPLPEQRRTAQILD